MILKNKINFCIIEDDPFFRDTFSSLLEEYGPVHGIGSFQEGLDYLKNNSPDILFVDMDLHGSKDGPKIVEFASKRDIHCVVVSSYDDDETISSCIAKGALDYFVKGDEVALVKDIITKYKNKRFSNKKIKLFESKNQSFNDSLSFLFNNINSDFPVLLSGPTGSGKSFLAKQIHIESKRKGKFVAVNCSSVPSNLFESEMFGHVKGAFSGAINNYDGKILEADHGTLYLDEIDSLPLKLQAKLLKVLEEKEFYKVGSNQIVKSNFRLVCSSQKDILELISEGKFREDLYYRISFIQTKVLPLKERREDIINLFKSKLSGPRKYFYSKEFISALESYPWPGNIRELQIFALNVELSRESHLTDEIARSLLNKQTKETYFLTEFQRQKFDEFGLDKFLKLMRSEVLKYALEKNDYMVNKTIKELGISSASFYRWKDINQD